MQLPPLIFQLLYEVGYFITGNGFRLGNGNGFRLGNGNGNRLGFIGNGNGFRDGSVFLLFAFLNNQLGFLPRLLEQSQSLWGHLFTLSVFNRDFFHILRTTKK